jgi:TonB family protein
VGLPADMAPPPVQPAPPPAPAAPPAEKKAEPKKTKKAAPPRPSRPVKAVVKKGALPELEQQKQKPAKQETEKPAQEAPAPPSAEPAKAEGKQERVNEPVSSEDFKFPQYLATIRGKIEQNWNPPPGIRGTKAKVQFRVVRSGRVADAKLQESSGNFYFDQAAVRAILLSSPFPEMPDGFYKDHEDFSVDLMEKE